MKKKINPKFSIDEFKKLGFRILRKWYWLILSLSLCLSIAFLVNKYSVPVYSIKSTLSIKKYDHRKLGPLDALDGNYFFNSNKDIDKECVMLRSLSNVSAAINHLGFDVSYYSAGQVNIIELFPASQIKLKYDTLSFYIPYNIFFKCIPENDSTYYLESDNELINVAFGKRLYTFNKTYTVNKFTFSIELLEKWIVKGQSNSPAFVINDLTSIADKYRKALKIGPTFKGSTILYVTMNSINPPKDIVFMNAYIRFLVVKGLIEKRDLALKTIAFLEEQIKTIGDSLNNFSGAIENHKIKSIDRGTSLSVLEQMKSMEQQKGVISMNINYLNYLNEYLDQKNSEEAFSPYFLGVNEIPINKLFDDYTKFRFETNLLKKESNRTNPFMNDRETKLKGMEQTIRENIKNQTDYYQKSLKSIEENIAKNLSSIKGLLSEERKVSKLEDMFSLHKSLYTSLFEKRIEAHIAKVNTSSDYEIIDFAGTDMIPITPVPADNYMKGLVIGLVIPILLIAFFYFTNDNIIDKDDLIKNTDIPLLGNIIHTANSAANIIVKDKPKSIIAESFRAIRSNMQYILREDTTSKVILITSTVSGEGKTFSAINFSYILALSNKRTILIGSDMRKPKMYDKFNVDIKKGLSTFLSGIAKLSDVIQKTDNENLDVITAGAIPPNPGELLLSPKLPEMIGLLKKEYDFIIFDTPPIGLVSDAIVITKLSDLNFFILRQNYSKKDYLLQLNQLYEEQKIKNIVLIFNDVNEKKFGYSYGYNYGYSYGSGYYEEDHQSFFDKLKSKFLKA